jgi:hypothetical protein
MKLLLLKTSITTLLLFAIVDRLPAQTNSSHADTEKFRIVIEQKREEMQKERPVYAIIGIEKQDHTPTISCWVGVFGHTNVIAYKPLPEQAFDAHLFDQNGKEISKVQFHHEFGQVLEPDKELLDGSYARSVDAMYGHSRKLDFKNWDGSNHYWDFDVMKSFRIKKTGEYRLQVQVRLFVQDTNGVFQPFLLTPVETKLKILESDLYKDVTTNSGPASTVFKGENVSVLDITQMI